MWTVDLSQVRMPNAALPGYAAAKRYEIETGGVMVNGSRILTDRDSQALITGAYSAIDAAIAAGTITTIADIDASAWPFS